MSYSNFTLDTVEETFQLKRTETAGVFADIEPVEPSVDLTKELKKKVPIAVALRTEKARSELIVVNVLVELREHFERRISFFSGIDFSVEPENGLTGVCDFLVSLSPDQFSLKSPIIIIVEAKNADPANGLGQCVAEMLAAQRFNAERGNDIQRVYGTTTTGTEWLFLKLEEQKLYVDMDIYQIKQCGEILGILTSMVEQKA